LPGSCNITLSSYTLIISLFSHEARRCFSQDAHMLRMIAKKAEEVKCLDKSQRINLARASHSQLMDRHPAYVI
jgi:hypothetical protein